MSREGSIDSFAFSAKSQHTCYNASYINYFLTSLLTHANPRPSTISPASFLFVSFATINDHRSTFSDGVARISARSLFIGVEQDMLIPSSELSSLADAINASGQRRAEFVELSSIFGHDAFLKETDHIGRILRQHLENGLERELADELVHNTHANSP